MPDYNGFIYSLKVPWQMNQPLWDIDKGGGIDSMFFLIFTPS